MPMPSVTISFTEKASTVVARGDRGIIAMIIKDSSVPDENPAVVLSEEDIPTVLSETNKEQIALALTGYVNTPRKVLVYVLHEESENYNEALEQLRTAKFNYLVCPSVAADGQENAIVSFIKKQRNDYRMVKAVLPNTEADHEGIINFATEKVYAGEKEYDTEEYCSRIAGILAGTPVSISATYAPLAELTDCTRLSKEEMDAAVDAGKFIVWHDGEKVKTARAVNSFLTTTEIKKDSFKKIKIVEAMDMILEDIRKTAEDNYLGKYANSYDNKCLLISAIGSYFDTLVTNGVLSSAEIGIDISANRTYLKGKVKDVDSMTEADIKTADTGSYVFLTARIGILDAIEDIVLPISI